MTGKKKKPLMDHDPLAWVEEDSGDPETVAETAEPVEEIKTDEAVATEKDMNEITLQDSEKLERVAELKEELLQVLEESGDITVNASAVKVIDAAALQLLVMLFQKAVKQGQNITIVEPSEGFNEAADLLGLSDLFGL